MAGLKRISTGLLAAFFLQSALCAPAGAQGYIDEEAFFDLSEQGTAAWEQAQAAIQRNDLAGACAQFTRAAQLWAQAAPDSPAEYEAANLNDTTKARQAANEFCQAAHGTKPFAYTDAHADAGLAAQQRDLQKGVYFALEQNRVAIRRYEEGDRAGACSAARLAADELARVVSAMRANPMLESSFGNPAQVYQNARDASEMRDDTFCLGIAG